jgi:ectoine hydroxylase-related dioxygenase (phytanoyl-CoA dioxygenase family)
VLGPDLKLSSLNIRSADPGGGARPLHADMAALPDARGSWVCNMIWLLDASTPDSGALGLVPGSHRRGQLPRQALADPPADHPGQVLVTGRAGTVVVPNADAWRAGRWGNTTGCAGGCPPACTGSRLPPAHSATAACPPARGRG